MITNNSLAVIERKLYIKPPSFPYFVCFQLQIKERHHIRLSFSFIVDIQYALFVENAFILILQKSGFKSSGIDIYKLVFILFFLKHSQNTRAEYYQFSSIILKLVSLLFLLKITQYYMNRRCIVVPLLIMRKQ